MTELENLPILYEWAPPPADSNDIKDIPELYRVVSFDDSDEVMVIAKYNNEWMANPYNLRPLIAELVKQATQLQTELANAFTYG